MRHSRALVPAVALAMLLLGCAPPSTSIGQGEVCAPSNQLIASTKIEVLAAPPGSTIRIESAVIFNEGGEGEDGRVESELMTGLTVGGSRTFTGAFGVDPGRCIHIFPTGGADYRVTLVPDNPIVQLLWALGFRNRPAANVVYGFRPGTLPAA